MNKEKIILILLIKTKNKMKNIKTKIIKKIPVACMVIVVAILLDVIIVKTTMFILDPVPTYITANVNAIKVKIYPEIKDPIKKYVLTEVYKAGLNPDLVERLINCESKWNSEAQVIEPNGTISSGLWQINSVHKSTIKPSDRLDYKASTEWAIGKIKRDGYSAWTCYKLI